MRHQDGGLATSQARWPSHAVVTHRARTSSPLDLSIGAYGDDHRDRAVLVTIARKRATGTPIPAAQVVLIGDTPSDVDAALLRAPRSSPSPAARLNRDTHDYEKRVLTGSDLRRHFRPSGQRDSNPRPLDSQIKQGSTACSSSFFEVDHQCSQVHA